METYILGLADAVPGYTQSQADAADQLARSLRFSPEEHERVRKIFLATRIQRRYSVLADYASETWQGELYGPGFPETLPGTAVRNTIYQREAPVLSEASARKALSDWGGDASDITHIVYVSCTGAVAPGIEFLLMQRLCLRPTVQRLHIGFMGCFGAFRGLATGRALAREDPKHRVLVVCTELCTLHMQADRTDETYIANALFADGSAAVVLGCEPQSEEKPLWELQRCGALAFENSLADMTWRVSDHGFVMTLSETVPQLIYDNIAQFASSLLPEGIDASACDWPAHPGGKAVLFAIAQALGLKRQPHLSASWEVLRNFGNMSSATYLFVLNALRRQTQTAEYSIGLGFGPGLSTEGTRLRRVYQDGTV